MKNGKSKIDRALCSSPFQHDWEEFESQRNPQGGGCYLTMRCTKCMTVFRQVINSDGSIEKPRQYTYPVGYRESNAGMSRADFRAAYLMKVR